MFVDAGANTPVLLLNFVEFRLRTGCLPLLCKGSYPTFRHPCKRCAAFAGAIVCNGPLHFHALVTIQRFLISSTTSISVVYQQTQGSM